MRASLPRSLDSQLPCRRPQRAGLVALWSGLQCSFLCDRADGEFNPDVLSLAVQSDSVTGNKGGYYRECDPQQHGLTTAFIRRARWGADESPKLVLPGSSPGLRAIFRRSRGSVQIRNAQGKRTIPFNSTEPKRQGNGLHVCASCGGCELVHASVVRNWEMFLWAVCKTVAIIFTGGWRLDRYQHLPPFWGVSSVG